MGSDRVDVRPLRWDRYEEVSPGELRLTFFASPYAGFEDVDRAEVVEDGDRVVVTLFVGNDPDLSGPVTLLASEQAVTVRLPGPLRGRAVVDGAI